MSLTGYSSSSLIPQQCSNYTLSGHYITHDYIAKNFTNIPPNHYAIIIRFSIVSIGNWTNQSITLITNDTYTLNSYSFPYICTDPDDICDQGTMDCIKAHDVILPHNTTSLIVNFTTNYTFIDNQFWGINNLIIAAKLCHPYCLLCFGGNQSQCFSCAENNYLQGNYCQKQCDKGSFKFDATR